MISSPCGARRARKFGRLFGRQVDHQQSVDTGPRRVGAQPLASVVENRIEVAEQDDRNLGLLAQLAHHREDRRPATRPTPARAPARADWPARPPSDRKTARPARSGRRRALPARAPGRAWLEVGVAGDDKRDQRRFAARAQFAKFFLDSPRPFLSPSRPAHRVTPKALATVCMSLSPRPDRLTIIDLFARHRGRELATACATACALSSAGMIPSVSDSRRKRLERLGVGDRDVLGAAGVLEPRELRADARIVEARRDRMGLANLPQSRPAAGRCDCRAARRRCRR